MGDDVHYNAIVEWRNAFGELNAGEYPKLPFYGALGIVYALVGALWGFLYFQHRKDVLPIQVTRNHTFAFPPRAFPFCWYWDADGRIIFPRLLAF